MDYSIRIPATDERRKILEERCVSKKELPRIKDILFKPVDKPLSEFHPDKIAVRIREFLGEDKPSTFIKMTFKKTESGYTDEKEDLGIGSTEELLSKAKEMGYEKWGEILTHSVEYNLNLDGHNAQVLLQEMTSLGIMLKIESETQEGLSLVLKLLEASKNEKIEKNTGVLLGEKLGLI